MIFEHPCVAVLSHAVVMELIGCTKKYCSSGLGNRLVQSHACSLRIHKILILALGSANFESGALLLDLSMLGYSGLRW